MKFQKKRNAISKLTPLLVISFASFTLCGVIVLSAQEPRFRLRNIPQRLFGGRDQAGKNADAKQAESTAAIAPSKTPGPAGEITELPINSSDSAVQSIDSNPSMDLGETRIGPASTIKNAPSSEASVQQRTVNFAEASEQPLVLATEAEKSQTIAQDWPKPWACLFITGRQHGYIEPCGCTGLENQKGGLNRRDTLLTQIRERGWEVVPIDAGDQVRRHGPQAEVKYASTVKALDTMKYAAVGFGPEELHLSTAPLLLSLTNLQGEFKTRFTSANVSVLTPEAPERFKIIELPNGRRIGMTSVLGDDYAKEVPQGEINIDKAVNALRPIAARIAEQNCDYTVLIIGGSLGESRRIAQAVPTFDLVITSGGHGEPLYKPEEIPGISTLMVQVGVKGMYTGLLGLYDDPNEPIRYQRVALSSQFEDSERMMKIFAEYQNQLQKMGFSKLGLKPLSHPSTREFVGTQTCAQCHTAAFEVWQNTPHAHATDSIVRPPGREDIPRHFDPECVSCHVTGWNPQEFYPYRSGYASLETTPHLTGSGCENCHGPGSQHVAFENGDLGDDQNLKTQLREEMRLTLDEARDKCLECHDLDNSPAFHKNGAFEEYWSEVAHTGLD